jgi:NAD(P)-dependent dehydrogenase (short-subunit alcohol dehydrogenase family)
MRYSKRSTAEQVTEGVDLSGKVALVTGCNSGIGAETVRVLAKRGAHVIGTAHTLDKAEKSCKDLSSAFAGDEQAVITPLSCELTNHIGHFLLVNLLMDKIMSSAAARIVNVSSEAHLQAPSTLKTCNLTKVILHSGPTDALYWSI